MAGRDAGQRRAELRQHAAIVEAVGRGEILAGLVNHYYLYRFLQEPRRMFRRYFIEDMAFVARFAREWVRR